MTLAKECSEGRKQTNNDLVAKKFHTLDPYLEKLIEMMQIKDRPVRNHVHAVTFPQEKIKSADLTAQRSVSYISLTQERADFPIPLPGTYTLTVPTVRPLHSGTDNCPIVCERFIFAFERLPGNHIRLLSCGHWEESVDSDTARANGQVPSVKKRKADFADPYYFRSFMDVIGHTGTILKRELAGNLSVP